CHALPAARYQERQVRLLDGPEWQRRVGDPEVPALVGERGVVHDASNDLDGFLQGFLPLSRIWALEAKLLELPEEIATAEPENEPARAHAVDVRAHSRKQARLAVADAAHERPEADARGDDRKCREGGPTVQPIHWVVGFPEGVEPEGLEALDETLKREPVRPFQRGHTQAEPNLALAFGYPRVRDPGPCLGISANGAHDVTPLRNLFAAVSHGRGCIVVPRG